MNAKYEDFKQPQIDNSPVDGFANFVESISNSPNTLKFYQDLQSQSQLCNLDGILPKFKITDQRTPHEEPDTDKLTPVQLELGKKLLKEGNFTELCKLAEELKKQGDQSIGMFEKRLAEAAKADSIEFKKDGVVIKFGDNANKGPDQYKNYEKLKINSDGTLGEAQKIQQGGLDNQNVSEKADAKATYAKLLERIKNNPQEPLRATIQ